MTNKTYVVCDMQVIPEQGYEGILVYLREVQSSEVQSVRIAERELGTMLLVNRMQKQAQCPEIYSSKEILSKLHERERGKFKGLYIVMEANPTLPKVGFTYEEIPKEWEHINEPSEKEIGQTNIGDLVKELWWNF